MGLRSARLYIVPGKRKSTPHPCKAYVVEILRALAQQRGFIPPSRWLWLVTEALLRPRGFVSPKRGFIPPSRWLWLITEAFPRPRGFDPAEPMCVCESPKLCLERAASSWQSAASSRRADGCGGRKAKVVVVWLLGDDCPKIMIEKKNGYLKASQPGEHE